jgi:AcrR family transcriptional regulator
MVKKTTAAAALKPRKMPRQKRSADTVAIIVEAAARVLERNGFEGFNTNAVAEKAGISIGSLYQYFPSKNSLLSAIIEREAAPLLSAGDELAKIQQFDEALRAYIRASVRHQMRRPILARLIDIAENRELFSEQVSGKASRVQVAIERILTLPDAPKVGNRRIAAADMLTVVRSLVDAAGARGEDESVHLMRRVEGAVWGYLRAR